MTDVDPRGTQLRDTVFRQTLGGYRISDVHDLLCRLAGELEAGQPPTAHLEDEHTLRRAPRGYHVGEVDTFVDRWRHDSAWGLVATPGTEWPVVTGRASAPTTPAAFGHSAGAEFWSAASLWGAVIFFVPIALVVWAAFYGRTDGVRSAQIGWAIAFFLLGCGFVVLKARKGTVSLGAASGPGHPATTSYPPPLDDETAPAPTDSNPQPRNGGAPPPSTDIIGLSLPLPGSEVEHSVVGRAVEADGFWPFVVSLGLLGLLPSGLLFGWAAFFGHTDGSRSSQVGWGVTVAVLVVGLLIRLGFTGTTRGAGGLTRIFLFHRSCIAPSEVEGFGTGPRGLPGLWMHRVGKRALQVPSALQSSTRAQAAETAAYVNAALGAQPSTDAATDAECDGSRPDAVEAWARWAWLGTLLTLGLAAPVVFLWGAVATRRRWLWLVTAAFADIGVLLPIGSSENSLPQNILGFGAWFASTVLILGVWVRTRRARLRTIEA